jgi:DNA-binding MarR family transcriptional regulator
MVVGTMMHVKTARDAAPQDTAEMAARLRLSSTRLARRLRQQADTGLTPSQLSALAAVDRHGPMTLGALAEIENVAPPSVTRIVSKLEADGLLQRAADSRDGRVVRVKSTAAGRSLLSASRRRKTAWLSSRLDALPDAQRSRIRAALDALDALVEES